MTRADLSVLRRFVRPKAEPATEPERCEICGIGLAPRHSHVVDLSLRTLACACPSCTVLFRDSNGARFRSVPDRVLRDPKMPLESATWSALGIPVNLCFVWFDSTLDRMVAHVPSPAGAVEVELREEAWGFLRRDVPLAGALVPDVEALLVYGRRGAQTLQCLLVPIDACFDLVGGVRRFWKGMDGGDDVRSFVEERLAELVARSRSAP